MQGHQRQELENVLSYLDQVKYKFGNQSQVYNDFLDIMKEFKSQSIDTLGVIQRVSNLLRGHPELIVGFNTFLPLGYRIEVQPNEQVQVSIPGTNLASGGTTGPTSLTILQSGPPTTTALHTSHQSQANHSSHTTSTHTSPGNAVNKSSAGSPGVHSLNRTPQTSQSVEFIHAIHYVNKIKNHFQGQPGIYKQFLEILHIYQKEQRNLKDGMHTATKPVTESEVYAQVAKLFQNQDDLLQEFRQFLPDAIGAADALVGQGTSEELDEHSKNVQDHIKGMAEVIAQYEVDIKNLEGKLADTIQENMKLNEEIQNLEGNLADTIQENMKLNEQIQDIYPVKLVDKAVAVITGKVNSLEVAEQTVEKMNEVLSTLKDFMQKTQPAVVQDHKLKSFQGTKSPLHGLFVHNHSLDDHKPKHAAPPMDL